MNNIKTYDQFNESLNLFKSKLSKWDFFDLETLKDMGFHKIDDTDNSPVIYVTKYFHKIKSVTIKNYITFHNKTYYDVTLSIYRLHHKKGEINKKFYNFNEMLKFLRRNVPELNVSFEV